MQLEFVVIVILSVLSVLSMVTLAVLVRLQRKWRQTDQQIAQLEARLALFDDGSQGLGRRLVELDHRLQKLVDQQASAKPAVAVSDAVSHAELIAMIQQGAEPDEIALRSGMSAAEVELLMLVHQKQLKEPVA